MDTPITAIGRREAEARRIAREDGHPIIGPADDWTSFSLNDDATVDGTTWRTTFVWNDEDRFEGHVYAVERRVTERRMPEWRRRSLEGRRRFDAVTDTTDVPR